MVLHLNFFYVRSTQFELVKKKPISIRRNLLLFIRKYLLQKNVTSKLFIILTTY